MSKWERKSYPPKLKVQAVLELLSNKLTVNQVCSKYGIHQSVLHNWKVAFLEWAEKIFERGSDPKLAQDRKQKYKEFGLILPEIGIGR